VVGHADRRAEDPARAAVFADSSGADQTRPPPNTSNVELGMKFQSSESGYVTGIRFYKGTGNTGTHTGTLWVGHPARSWRRARSPARRPPAGRR